MARVACEVSETEEREQPAVSAECSRCGHTTTSLGTTERSVKRCLALMRDECPRDERNFYVEESDE